jgi:branched-subunit amino acid transport protein AzlD
MLLVNANTTTRCFKQKCISRPCNGLPTVSHRMILLKHKTWGRMGLSILTGTANMHCGQAPSLAAPCGTICAQR